MALTYRFVNSFQYEYDPGNKIVSRKFLPYAGYATSGFTFDDDGSYTSIALGQSYSMGLPSGGATEETLFPIDLGGSSSHVLLRFDTTQVIGAGFFTGRTTVIRFQSGSAVVASVLLDPVFTGPGLNGLSKIEIWASGDGDNAQTGGSMVATTDPSFPLSSAVVTSFEVRIDFHASNARVQVWLDHASVLDVSGLAISGTPDTAALRMQGNGVITLMGIDNLVVATDDAATALKIGPVEVAPIAVSTASREDPGWTPNSGTHVSRINETSSPTPDDDTTYLAAAGSTGDELYKLTPPACYGKILALALNAGVKTITGSPALQLRMQLSGRSAENFGSALTPETARYAVLQRISQLRPDGETWTDGDITEGRFGWKQPGSGEQRVTLFYGEKLVSLAGEDYTCPAGTHVPSYIH